MNLQDTLYPSMAPWLDAKIRHIVSSHMSEADTPEERLLYLQEMVAALIERVAQTDQDALDIIGTYRWELIRKGRE